MQLRSGYVAVCTILGVVVAGGLINAGSAGAVSRPVRIAGDLTGDGTVDQLTFTATPDLNGCIATVTPRDTTGVYAKHVYNVDLPDVNPAEGYDRAGCPVVTDSPDTNGDGVQETILEWLGADGMDLLLRTASGFAAYGYGAGGYGVGIDQPYGSGHADLNGDNRDDVFVASDEAFFTWLGQPDGALQSTPDPQGMTSLNTFNGFNETNMTPNADGRDELLFDTAVTNECCQTTAQVYSLGHGVIDLVSSSSSALFHGTIDEPTTADVNSDGWRDVNITGYSDATSTESTFTAFQRNDHTFYLGVTTTVGAGRAVYGQANSVTATVAQTSSTGIAPTGTVSFLIDGVARPAVKISGGHAYTPIQTLSVGSHSVVSRYSGDANHVATTSPPTDITVAAAGSTTTLATSVNPASYGTKITFTATVLAKAPGAGKPTGSVQFVVDGSVKATVPLGSTSKATYSVSTLTKTKHAVAAVYVGSTNYTTSKSATLSQTVK